MGPPISRLISPQFPSSFRPFIRVTTTTTPVYNDRQKGPTLFLGRSEIPTNENPSKTTTTWAPAFLDRLPLSPKSPGIWPSRSLTANALEKLPKPNRKGSSSKHRFFRGKLAVKLRGCNHRKKSLFLLVFEYFEATHEYVSIHPKLQILWSFLSLNKHGRTPCGTLLQQQKQVDRWIYHLKKTSKLGWCLKQASQKKQHHQKKICFQKYGSKH